MNPDLTTKAPSDASDGFASTFRRGHGQHMTLDTATYGNPPASSIHDALMQVREHIGPMDKRKVQSFKAFTVDDIYSTLRPLFTEYGIHVESKVLDHQVIPYTDKEGRRVTDAIVHVLYTFVGPDGSTAQIEGVAEGRDYQDKATNKALQQAFKYALIQMFQISTGEVGPDASAIEVEVPNGDDVQRRVWAVQQRLVDEYEGDRQLAEERWQVLLDTVGVGDQITADDVTALEATLGETE